jgi:4-hydroxy-tetrahydrodipicolinate reductase
VSALRVGVFGASGRMGRAVVRVAAERGHQVASAVATAEVGADAGTLAGIAPLGVAVAASLDVLGRSGANVVVDFSSPAAVPALADACAAAGLALVSGTTGLDEAGRAALDRAASRVPVLWEPNMSVGVWVLARLVERAVALLGPGFDVEIVEAHHRQKVDAPSGTALRLAEVAKAALDSLPGRASEDARFVYGREGKPGARPANEVGVLAMRGGDVIGDHSVHLLGIGERIELAHRASSRDLFARGAVRAAEWIAGRAPGRYGLGDVLG